LSYWALLQKSNVHQKLKEKANTDKCTQKNTQTWFNYVSLGTEKRLSAILFCLLTNLPLLGARTRRCHNNEIGTKEYNLGLIELISSNPNREILLRVL